MNEINFNKKLNLYIKKDETRLLKYINPDYFIEHNSTNKEYLINLFQMKLHSLTYSYLNGGFSNAGYLFYPLLKGNSQNIKQTSKQILEIRGLLKKKGTRLDITCKDVPSLICSAYKSLNKIKNNKKDKIKNIKCKSFISLDYKKDKEYLRPLFRLNRYVKYSLSKYLLDFHIHGSIASKDYIKGYSDFDTLAIIKKSSFTPKKLKDIRKKLFYSRKFLCNIDPLQHHGHMLITEFDLNYYPETFFPLVLFSYSKSLLENKYLKIRLRKDKVESITALFDFVHYFRKLKIENKRLDSYNTKYLLHAIALFPSLYLQAKGRPTYKKNSFALIKKEFDKKLLKPIKTMTKLRGNWKSPKTSFITKIFSYNPVLAYQLNSKIWDIKNSLLKQNNIDTKRLIQDMLNFSEIAWENVKESL